MHDALSPLDGRYQKEVAPLRLYFSEEALVRVRLFVEVGYFVALCTTLRIKVNPKKCWRIVNNFNTSAFKHIKRIESRTNHDVKAIEYYLRGHIKTHQEFIHFGLTSEDVNNLAYGLLIHESLKKVLIPSLTNLIGDIKRLAKASGSSGLLSLTHGQPATPTTLQKELLVFTDRLERQLSVLKKFRMQGKFGGAVGNLAAHFAAYPDIRWESFAKKFVKAHGLTYLPRTTQINPHDDLAELSHIFHRTDSILLNLSQDMWLYISRGIFTQRTKASEVGSSTMPHKVNPIDFENAEGNLGLARALFHHFAEKFPISRLQRDLSDSTVERNIGVAFGYHLLAVTSLAKGITKLSINKKRMAEELFAHPEVTAELIQTVLRAHGIKDAYEHLKTLTRGKSVSAADFTAFINAIKLPKEAKNRLLSLISLSPQKGIDNT
ncbi:adenylosuccinate lyase [Candidatus Peregrinibacteria bacterium]|nr:adenylosuccinate lyase [Candidatus Peregrinibacteria bacterium]